ncbi:helix-turn-helix domain containing protein [Pseudomonas fluorescens]|uniref:helix-turn-helix domain-containing protein n=1 Tax=Pseudomonas fluorescens TaxID=294 RepID=UPI002732700D|nr:helix-turn-helix domain-containing protein [Pseudomonas fluorescens]WLH71951.1 helix-turn-helix domain containing protein [Pseudomonas fluorescens]
MQHAFVLKLITEPTNSIKTPPAPNLLSPAELELLNARFAANAKKWLIENAPAPKTVSQQNPKSASGRKPKVVENPFYMHIGCMTDWGRYPVFALDIIEGVARLDWHGRAIGVGGKSTPLSVRRLAVILESLPVITTDSVMDLLRLETRHASRYVKAMELIIPQVMQRRPETLRNEMEGIKTELKQYEWEDLDTLSAPSTEELAKLHYDLRTLTQFKSAEEYEQDHEDELVGTRFTSVIALPTRKEHPKRYEVMGMLAQGFSQSEIERLTGVQRKTVRRWQAETLALTA